MQNNFKKILLLVSVLIFLLMGIIFTLVYKKINDNNQKIGQDMKDLQIATNGRDNIVSLNKTLQRIAPDRVLLDQHFIKSSNVVPLLDTIENLAARAGVVSEIDSVDTKANNVALVIALKASGKFEGIYKFLTLLENSPYVLDFTSMDLHKISSTVAPDKIIYGPNWEVVFQMQLLSFIP